jgi:hypothetical protein
VLRNLAVTLTAGALLTGCTTVSYKDDEYITLRGAVEIKAENLRKALDYCAPRTGGMYDLARETKVKVDNAMRERGMR